MATGSGHASAGASILPKQTAAAFITIDMNPELPSSSVLLNLEIEIITMIVHALIRGAVFILINIQHRLHSYGEHLGLLSARMLVADARGILLRQHLPRTETGESQIEQTVARHEPSYLALCSCREPYKSAVRALDNHHQL